MVRQLNAALCALGFLAFSASAEDQELHEKPNESGCLACHQEIPTESLAVSLLHHVAKYADALPKTSEQHAGLVNKTLLFAAWGQAGGAVAMTLAALAVAGWLTIRWRRRKPTPDAQATTDPAHPDQGQGREA